MIKVVFCMICALSLLASILTGNTSEMGFAVVEGLQSAVDLSLTLLGVLCLWGGIMRVFSAGGIIKYLTKLLKPILRFIYPDAARKNNGLDEISASMTANFFGLGNAATTFSLAAVSKLQENSGDKERASADLITFTVLNTCAVNFIPTTLIALRYAAGSADPFEIVVPVWLCSLACYGATAFVLRAFALFREK